MQRTSSFLLSAVKAAVTCMVISGIVLLLTSPAFAGAPLENPSGTFVAYIDYVVPGDAEASEDFKTIYFYDRENNTRYRGSYYPFGLTLASYPELTYGDPTFTWDGGGIYGANLELIRWQDDETIIVEASVTLLSQSGTAGTTISALHTVSITGRTTFAEYTNRPDSSSVPPSNDAGHVWDMLKEAARLDEFCRDICAEDVPINQEYAPLVVNSENWSTPGFSEDYAYLTGIWLADAEEYVEYLRGNILRKISIEPCFLGALKGIIPDPEGRQDTWEVWPAYSGLPYKLGLLNGHYAIVYYPEYLD